MHALQYVLWHYTITYLLTQCRVEGQRSEAVPLQQGTLSASIEREYIIVTLQAMAGICYQRFSVRHIIYNVDAGRSV